MAHAAVHCCSSPGHLTREFLAGRRARYLPPVRLYLVLSVVFFLVATPPRTPSFAVLSQVNEHPDRGKAQTVLTPLTTRRTRRRGAGR